MDADVAHGEDQAAPIRMPHRLPRLPRERDGRIAWVVAAAWASAFVFAVGANALGIVKMVGLGLGPEMAIWILPSALFLIVAMPVGFRRKNMVALLVSISFLLLSATNFAAHLAWPESHRSTREIISNLGWLMLIVGLLTFPKGAFVPRWTIFIVGAAVVVLTIDSLRALSILKFPDILAIVALLALLGARLPALVLRLYRAHIGVERRQLGWVLVGLSTAVILVALSLMSGIVTSLLIGSNPSPQALRFQSDILWLGGLLFIPAGFACLALSVFIALSGYGLRLADKFVRGSVLTAVLGFGLTICFFLVTKALHGIAANYVRTDPKELLAAVGGIISFLLAVPARTRLGAWVNRRFPDPLAELRDGTPSCLDALRQVAGSDELADEVLHRVVKGVRAEHAALVIEGTLVARHEISEADIETWRAGAPLAVAAAAAIEGDETFPLRVPLRIRDGGAGPLLGWLLVGPRSDGEGFEAQERQVLSGLAGPIARAMRAARQHEEGNRRLEALLRGA